MIKPNGEKYEGNFRYSIECLRHSSIFRNGKRDGFGVYYWPDGLSSDYYKFPSTSRLEEDLMASGMILASQVFDLESPLLPGASIFDNKSECRALIWEFSGAVIILLKNRLIFGERFEVKFPVSDFQPEELSDILMPVLGRGFSDSVASIILALLGLDQPSALFAFHMSDVPHIHLIVFDDYIL